MKCKFILIAVCATACGELGEGDGPDGDVTFDPPAVPAHDDSEDGYLHARGKSTPFLCRDGGGSVPCPTDGRPVDERLSCDAAGCHGDAEYFSADEGRHLLGSDGPSCYTCHDKEWSDTTGRNP